MTELLSLESHAKLHLAILGERQVYHTTAKNYGTKQIKNEFLKQSEVIPVLMNWNKNGFTTWLSINDKEEDKITGVIALQDFWLDIDSRPKGVDDRIATNDELQKALDAAIKIKKYIENNYAAIGYLAKSGNGFHIHFPLPRFNLPLESREQVNKKVRTFAKAAAKVADVKIDNTYDIARRTTLIGTANNKLPGQPLQTSWEDTVFEKGLNAALEAVERARSQNQKLLNDILCAQEEKPKTNYAVTPKQQHIDIEQLCQLDLKFYDLYKVANKENKLHVSKYSYKSRSEAEASIVTRLVLEGFNDEEIAQVMENCSLGKWQERPDAYRTLTLQNARQKAGEIIKEEQTRNRLMEEIASSGKPQQATEKISIADINPVKVAKEIMSKYNFVRDKNTKLLWVYNEITGIYTENSEDVINGEIVKLLDDFARSHHANDVYFYIYNSAPIEKMNPKPEWLGVENGILNVFTRELRTNGDRKELYVTAKIPIKYDDKAECPKIQKFLSEILDEPKRKIAQEFIGYCLLRDHRYKKAYIANGPTDTGKTVHQNLNTALIGEENITNQTIQNINHNRFSTAELFNKMANFCDDMPSGIVKVTGNFKMATGNGRLGAERKGKDPFNFHSYAKFWLNCNQLPPVSKSEDTDAYYNRLIIVDYVNRFTKELGNVNPNLTYELTTPEELSGYLNYALDGLERLIKNKRFSETMSKEDIRSYYIKRTNSAQYFIENYIETTDEYSDLIFHEDLFREAVKICHQENLSVPKKAELTEAMHQNCSGAQPTKARKDPKKSSIDAWRYIKLKTPQENNEGQSKLFAQKQGDIQTQRNTTKTVKQNDQEPLTETPQKTSGVNGVFGAPSSNCSKRDEENKSDTSKKDFVKNSGELKTPPPNAPNTPDSRPTWVVKNIPSAEKCDGIDCKHALAVTLELTSPTGDVLRRCTICLDALRRKFPTADWQPYLLKDSGEES